MNQEKTIQQIKDKAVITNRYYIALLDLYNELKKTDKVSMQRFFTNRQLRSNTAVVIVNEGIIQRVGTHRATKYYWLADFPSLEMAQSLYEKCIEEPSNVKYNETTETDKLLDNIVIDAQEVRTNKEFWETVDKIPNATKKEKPIEANSDDTKESKYAGCSYTKYLFGLIKIKTEYYHA